MSSYIKTDDHITFCSTNGEVYTIYNSEECYQDVEEAIKEKDWETTKKILDRSLRLRNKIEQTNNPQAVERITIKNGLIHVDNVPMDGALTNRMLKLLNDGYDIQPFKLFLLNLLQNPSYRSVNELYDFLESSDLPITEDGHFLAYKRIRNNFTDIFTGKLNNEIGATVKMDRNQVDDNKNRTCSKGLHFCSKEYLPHYGTQNTSITVIIKINPRDVVSIPVDYRNAKGRCCEYTVVRKLITPNERIESSLMNTQQNKSTLKKLTILQKDMYGHAIINRFDSVKEASKKTGIDSSNIRKVLINQRYTAGGYHWDYDNNHRDIS